MKIYYSSYKLTPLKKANNLSSLEAKEGTFIKGVLNSSVLFADYFPHPPLGDLSVEEFLAGFKFQDKEYDKKVFDLLLNDKKFQTQKSKAFKNHELFSGLREPKSSVVKYKIMGHGDRGFLSLLQKNITLRLDANGLFNRSEFIDFFKSIPTEFLPLIEYVEDPLHETDWSNFLVKKARDFIPSQDFDFYIYKPNAEFKPKTNAPVIYSSYLGADLGRWHAYCELIHSGDLSLVHGIHTPDFYLEQEDFFDGSFDTSFQANENKVKKMYQKVSDSNWKFLCSM